MNKVDMIIDSIDVYHFKALLLFTGQIKYFLVSKWKVQKLLQL